MFVANLLRAGDIQKGVGFLVEVEDLLFGSFHSIGHRGSCRERPIYRRNRASPARAQPSQDYLWHREKNR